MYINVYLYICIYKVYIYIYTLYIHIFKYTHFTLICIYILLLLLLYIYIYIYIYKSKRKKKSYAEIVKEKISERKGDKQKMLAVECKKNDEKQGNLDYYKQKNKKGVRSKF